MNRPDIEWEQQVADKILLGDRDNYDGADGARTIRNLCGWIVQLENQISSQLTKSEARLVLELLKLWDYAYDELGVTGAVEACGEYDTAIFSSLRLKAENTIKQGTK